MIFIQEIISRFRNLQVSVTVDKDLLPHLTHVDKESTERVININLYKLIYFTGAIQTRRKSPSNRMKFFDQSYLIDWIYDSEQFRVKIDEIRRLRGSEVLHDVSEDLGVGISIMIAKELFDVKDTTIQRIYGTNKKRPDWKCLTEGNRTLIVESKGASSQAISNAQREDAITQKQTRIADVRVASLTLIKENQISTNNFIDPPSTPENMDIERKTRILRAGHYSSVFSFLGHAYLSKYYSKMRKRLLDEITSEEQRNKDLMFNELRFNYPIVRFLNHDFAGTFYKIAEKSYFFVGIDNRLLSYEGFKTFQDYETDIERIVMDNRYILFKDGILLIEVLNIRAFEDIVLEEDVKSYQENNTISDVDEMQESTFEKYFEYLLAKTGFEIEKEQIGNARRPDILGFKGRRRFIFELNLTKEEIQPEIIERLLSLGNRIRRDYTIVLITNAKVVNIEISGEHLIIIGRNELKLILQDHNKLNYFLGIEE